MVFIKNSIKENFKIKLIKMVIIIHLLLKNLKKNGNKIVNVKDKVLNNQWIVSYNLFFFRFLSAKLILKYSLL